jgi:hypothetical protein
MSFHRSPDDELLILASDGLWDVFNAQEAVQLALRSNTRACEKGASRSAACRVSASVLTRAAIERGSRDNITVLVIDLQRPDSTTMTAILAAQCSDDMSGRVAGRWLHGKGGGLNLAGLPSEQPVSPGLGNRGHHFIQPHLSLPLHRRTFSSTVTTAGPVVLHGAAAAAGAAAAVRQPDPPTGAGEQQQGQQQQARDLGKPPRSGGPQRYRSQSFSCFELGGYGAKVSEVRLGHQGPVDTEELQLPFRAVTTGFVAR